VRIIRKDLRTGCVAVTSQNHGYAVAPDTLPPGTAVTHLNLNDGTCEGFFDEARQLLAVQYHPSRLPVLTTRSACSESSGDSRSGHDPMRCAGRGAR
jgi:hypothetical protein